MAISRDGQEWPEGTAEELYPMRDWQYEVANGDTLLGYVEWLEHKREAG